MVLCFGCIDSKDEFDHYLTCPILWQLAKAALNMRESNFPIEHRLCLVYCKVNKLKLLGCCHSLYHAIRKDSECIGGDGNVLSTVVELCKVV